jgi:hypothetical protein
MVVPNQSEQLYKVTTLDASEVTQSLKEGPWQLGTSAQVARQVAYSSDLGRLLRLGSEQRGEGHRPRAGEERAPVYQWIIPQGFLR